jgi:FkbM family methyltransferase
MDSTLIYDVGMHKGEDTDYYLKLGFRVVGFEADPELIATCKSRFAAPVASGQLHIVEGAIAPLGYGEEITFFRSSLSVWGTVEHEWEERNRRLGAGSTPIKVKRVDVTHAFRAFGIPFYVKIDVEGVDRLIVEALQLFPERPRFLSIESEKVSFARVVQELKLLHELGYKKFNIVQQADVPGSRITTCTISGQALEYTFPEHSSGPFGDDLNQRWVNLREAVSQYRRIFAAYRLLGDGSIFYRTVRGRRLISKLETWSGKRLPGWYDTHARRD